MKRSKRFKRGELLQNQCTGAIYIYVKSAGNRKVYLVELDEYGQPIELITLDAKYIGPLKLIPETFKQITL